MRGLWLFWFTMALAGGAPIEFNGSFEAGRGGQVPAGWTVLRGSAAGDRRIHKEGRSALRLEAAAGSDAWAQSKTVELTVGKRYELRGWVRTEDLTVRDLDRSPIAVGATVSMASMPFDVHAESVGGTKGWTPLRLRFTATRSQDQVVVEAGYGGSLRGRAWFDGLTLGEVSAGGEWPQRAAVRTFGPGYRYPAAGWIYLHIEGAPYERGYQHGYLMASEIEQYLDRCAKTLGSKSRQDAWRMARTTADALFLRGFDREILQEMKGIADGATAGGAKWAGRAVDLVDIATANTIVELDTLREAVRMTPTGLEGLGMERPAYADPKRDVMKGDRCSAFAATGPATRNGKMMVGHVTFWPLVLAEQTNVMLDIQPSTGHRVLMQSYPGGIESGTDYYQNDAGVVLTETTIRQGPFRMEGLPVAFRARKAIQYGGTLEKVVEYLGTHNNGLYTNEWLIGDAKSDEIAMYELGTRRSKLYRSSKGEWFGDTPGFYWGCNNAKDLGVRLEYAPDPKGTPAHLPFEPAPRDVKWQELYEQYKGKMDEQFAALAFRTAPLIIGSSMDAKFTTSEMAAKLMCWAAFGKPNQREWVAEGQGLYPAGYRMFAAGPAMGKQEEPRAAAESKPGSRKVDPERLWKGWILPSGDGDLWLTAGSSTYHRILRSDDPEKELEGCRATYRATAAEKDIPLRNLTGDTRSQAWVPMAHNKGALALDALRGAMGDDRFLALMRDFFAEHSTRAVSSEAFLAAAGKAAGKPVRPLMERWLSEKGLPDGKAGAAYPISHLAVSLNSAIIIYGTTAEAGANRYAAERLRDRLLDWYESQIPIRKDFEVTDDDLHWHDLVLIGRPETNSALAAWKEKLGLDYDGALFRMAGKEHASEGEALLAAAANPVDAARMVVVMAGNSPLATVRLAGAEFEEREYVIFKDGKPVESGFLKH